jgi:lipopolysaccharide transport system permease protein
MFWYGILPTAAVLWLPALVLLSVLTAAAGSVWLSALNVQYRDVRYVVPFVIQLWLFASPVIYPASSVPERWRTLYFLNPMAGVIEGFRWALVGGSSPGWTTLASAGMVVTVLLLGMAYFRRLEGTFADRI